jgi:hypothetical protein
MSRPTPPQKKKAKASAKPALATSDQIADIMSGLRSMSEILSTLVAGAPGTSAPFIAVGAGASSLALESGSTPKIDLFGFTVQLTSALEDYSGRKPVMTFHELEGIPTLGLDSIKKAGLKGFLEGRFSAYGLQFQPNDIPPLDTVAKLRDKAWSRIPAKHKA